MQNIPLFGSSASLISPPAGTVTSGFLPLQYLPAEYLNYYLNAATQAVQEIVNLESAAGFSPSASFQLLGSLALDQVGIVNASVAASVAASALTIAMKQSAGSDCTTSGYGAVQFRSSTLTSGAKVIRQVTAALSLVIPSTATMGFTNAIPDSLYVYAIDNAGTVELAVSTEDLWDEGLLWTTTALSAGSTSRTVLYSTTARSNVAIRFLGRIDITEATAGTWATAPTVITGPLGNRSGVISASGTGMSLTSPNAVNVASIVIPAGTWDLSGAGAIAFGASTSNTVFNVGISATSATVPLGGAVYNSVPLQNTGEVLVSVPIPTPAGTVWNSTQRPGTTIPTYRVKFQTQTTLYLIVAATFTISTADARGWIQARRVR